MEDGGQILAAGALLAGGIAASLVAGRLRVPGLLLFLALGMAIGSDGLGWIDFGDQESDFELERTVGIVALALILFEGGLAAGWSEIRPVLAPSLSLAVVGTLGTAAIVGLAAGGLLDLSTTEGLLLGSIVAATDSAAIFSVLRGSSLDRRLARTLEGESGFNDPVAIVLVIGLIEALTHPPHGAGAIALEAVIELSIGLAIGIVVGWLATRAFQAARFSTPGLYPVASIATAACSFGAADVLHGSGFLAVYITGLVLGTVAIPGKRTIDDFHDGLAWVSQIAVFISLGLLVDPGEFGGIAGEALLISGVLMFVARPIAAAAATLPLGFSPRESLLVGWAGLRGAVPIVLATFAVIEDVDRAGDFFNIVFFVVIASTLVQGATFAPLARVLGVTGNEPESHRPLMEVGAIRQLGAEVVEFPVRDGDAAAGRLVNELGLPREALVSVIVREGEALLPRGSTEIAAGDRMHILVSGSVRKEVEELFGRWRDGPFHEPVYTVPALTSRARVFSVKPWRSEHGDAGAPGAIGGVAVVRTLRTRRGGPGALVVLEDGRIAVTGDGLVATGGARQLFRWCRDRIETARDPEARAWWQEVAGAVARVEAAKES